MSVVEIENNNESPRDLSYLDDDDEGSVKVYPALSYSKLLNGDGNGESIGEQVAWRAKNYVTRSKGERLLRTSLCITFAVAFILGTIVTTAILVTDLKSADTTSTTTGAQMTRDSTESTISVTTTTSTKSIPTTRPATTPAPTTTTTMKRPTTTTTSTATLTITSSAADHFQNKVHSLQSNSSWKYLSSPNYPNEYNHNADIWWLIRDDSGGRITLQILDMDLESQNDHLRIYDGDSSSDTLLANLHGSIGIQSTYQSSGDNILLVFKSDGSVSEKGFKLRYQRLSSSNNTTLNETGNGCMGFEGMEVHIENNFGYITRCSNNHCGSSIENRYQDALSVESSASGTASVWTLVQLAGKCALKADNGMFATLCVGCMGKPTQPEHDYGVFLHHPNSTYQVALWHMEVVRYTTTNKPVYNFRGSHGKYLSACKYCVHDSSEILALAHDITGKRPCSVWQIKPIQHIKSHPQNEVYSLQSNSSWQFLSSPNYPNEYNHNVEIWWLIHAYNGGRITLQILDMDLESENDYLRIYDGGNSSVTLLANLHGSIGMRSTYQSSSDNILLVFKSDGSVSEKGFKLSYQTSSSNSITLNETANGCMGFEGKKVHIRNRFGYITRCSNNQCGSSIENKYQDALSVQLSPNNHASVWTLVELDGKCALKADNDMFATLCIGCVGDPSQPEHDYGVFLHHPNSTYQVALWHMEAVRDTTHHETRYNFRGSHGKYLAACRYCVNDSSEILALAHAIPGNRTYSVWQIESIQV